MAEITNGPRTVPLKSPVKLLLRGADGNESEQEVSVLHFRKPQGADFRALDKDKGEIGKLMAFAAQITDQPGRVIDKLEAEDFAEVMKVTVGFMEGFQEIGAALSAT